jgi:hypothetical protein
MESILGEIQSICISAAGAAVTALVAYMFNWLRTYLEIKESDSNEAEIRNAAMTEAGKLVQEGKIANPEAVLESATKIISDLLPAIKAEDYNTTDIKDMIIGAAATFFPPAGLLKFLK